MAPDAPAVSVPLLAQPIVTQDLGVKVVRLERGMMDMHLGALEKEKAVVVDELVAPVETEEDGDVDVVVVVHELRNSWSVGRADQQVRLGCYYLAGVEVEVAAVKLVAFGIVGYAHSEVTELVHRRRSLLEALELVDTAVLLDGLRSVRDWLVCTGALQLT